MKTIIAILCFSFLLTFVVSANDKLEAKKQIIDFIQKNSPSAGWKEFTCPDYKSPILEDPFIVNYSFFTNYPVFRKSFTQLGKNIEKVGPVILKNLLRHSLSNNNLKFIYNISTILGRNYPDTEDINNLIDYIVVEGRKGKVQLFGDREENFTIINSITNRLLLKCINIYLLEYRNALFGRLTGEIKETEIKSIVIKLIELRELSADYIIKSWLNDCIVICYSIIDKNSEFLAADFNQHLKYLYSLPTNLYANFTSNTWMELLPVNSGQVYELDQLLLHNMKINRKSPYTYIEYEIWTLCVKDFMPIQTNMSAYINLLNDKLNQMNVILSVTNVNYRNREMTVIKAYSLANGVEPR